MRLTLAVENLLIGVWMSHNDGHPLPVRVKWQHMKHLIFTQTKACCVSEIASQNQHRNKDYCYNHIIYECR